MYEERRGTPSRLCFLPTQMQVGVEKYGYSPEKLLNNYRSSFLRNAYGSKKVYLPLKDGTHWYLAVVLTESKQVHLVDSAPMTDRNGNRMKVVGRMMAFLHDLFEKLYSELEKMNEAPNIRNFQLIIPDKVPIQENG
ncbi:unnamed protein product [Linum tenue]|uniref:Ubiquitin-like protease family profile domain-containing protein n=1 Tax=Linum tenue TaxID=586396 RepID=A0AAV0KPT6_9ROSI|nr:unnamed protein product [Linum tenue]